MFILDRLFIGGIRFVLANVAAAVDHEMNDEDALRQELLATHARLELGEITEDEFRSLEAAILARLRAIKEEREGVATDQPMKITGVELETSGEEHEEPEPGKPRRGRAP